MNDRDAGQAWLAAWHAAWGSGPRAATPEEMARRLVELGQDYAGIARDSWKFLGGGPGAAEGANAATMQAAFADSYRRLLISAAPFDARQPGTGIGLVTAVARCQRAWQALASQGAEIAADASRRLAAALADEDPAARPITNLRALHDLWVECGEAAWAAAVHQDSYAAVQAEWLAAMVELMQEQRHAAAAQGAEPRP